VLDLPRDTPEFLFGTSCEEEVRGCHLDIFISRIDQGAKTCRKDENRNSPTYYVNPRRFSLSLSRARAIDESFSAKKTREIRSILDQRHPALLQLSRVTCSTCYLGQRTTFERHSVSSTRATRCEGMPSVPFLFLVWIQKFVSARATRNLSLPTRLRYQTDSSSTELTQLSRRIMSQNRTKRNRSGWWNEATRNLSPDLPDDRQDFPKLIYAETRIAKHRSRTRRAHRLSPSEYRASAVPITTRPNLWGTFDIIARAISS